MANILQIKNIGQKIARILYRDMGDGTHAEVVVVSGLPTDGLTDVELRATAVSVTPVSDTQPGLAANTHAPVAATAAVVTRAAAGAGVMNVLAQIVWSLSVVPAAAVNLMVQDGANTVFTTDITASGPGFIQFNPPMRGTANTALIITLASGAGAVIGKVSVHAWTE